MGHVEDISLNLVYFEVHPVSHPECEQKYFATDIPIDTQKILMYWAEVRLLMPFLKVGTESFSIKL